MNSKLTLSLLTANPGKIFKLLPSRMNLLNAEPEKSLERLGPYFDDFPLLLELWNLSVEMWSEGNDEGHAQVLGMLGILVALLDSESASGDN